ncbi:MAG: hypothetical protein WC325_11565 [Candidatus Bathyarchaeia archaeon]|jgi:hypothetical protein
MQNTKALKCTLIFSLIILFSFSGVTYALAYTVKNQVLYTQTFEIEPQEQIFTSFYLPAPATLFEVKLAVSQGTIKWTPYSATLFEDTVTKLPYTINETTQGWECETGNGTVKWRIDQENLNQIWYLCLCNPDTYTKQVTVQVTKTWSTQNYQTWN